jgi:mRNA-degrading endonuclease RelE of RelBE toxin-antitoxin system
MRAYRVAFSEAAAEFLLDLPRRRQRQVITLARQLAADPFLRSDYALPDEQGREIEHLLIEDYVFAYWLDHAVGELRIVDLEDAS